MLKTIACFLHVEAGSIIYFGVFSKRMAEEKKEKMPKILSMPNWVWAVLVVGVLLFLVLNSGTAPNAGTNTGSNTDTGTNTGDNSLVHTTPLPDTVVGFTITPATPKAGEDVTFTTSVLSEYILDWQNKFLFELWVRQFGNWQKTSCYSSPCTYVYKDASQGTLEYKIVRTATNGSVSEEGSYYLDVASTSQTGDTLGPKVTVFHSPQNPKAGQTVSIQALVNDISGIERVELYANGEIIKTCPQQVKISQCQASISNLVVGQGTYYAYAVDIYGNETTSPTLTYTVAVS